MSVGHTVTQAVSHLPLTAEARVRARLSPRRICGGNRSIGTDFSPSSSVIPCQYHSTVTLHIHIIWGMNNRPGGAAVQAQSHPIDNGRCQAHLIYIKLL
jgi:hypothetical protein